MRVWPARLLKRSSFAILLYIGFKLNALAARKATYFLMSLCYDKVSNLKYESVRVDSKTVVFIRPNPGKKETTDRSGSDAFSFGIGALFRKC